MTKKEVYFNKHAYDGLASDLENSLSTVQGYVDAFNSMGIGNVENADLQLLFEDPEELAKNKITNGETATLAGLPVKKERLFEMIEKPKEMDKLNANRIARNYNYSNYIIEAGFVKVKPLILNRLKEQNTVYITTKKQQDIYDAMQDAAKALNRLKSLTGGYFETETLDTFLRKEVGRHAVDAPLKKTVDRKGRESWEPQIQQNKAYWDFAIKPEVITKY